MVQVLVARVDIGVVIHEAMTPQCGRSVSSGPGCQSGYRSGDLQMYKDMTSQCGRSIFYMDYRV